MSKPDIIVIGGSAGAVEAVSSVVSGLPTDLQAAVFVVIHISPFYSSSLPRIITANGCLRAQHAETGQLIESGRIYVAPPDYHLLVESDRIHLWHGPKENHLRPAINALFRSAAVAHRDRVIGVILSGMLDDGSAGLWWVKHFGGLAVVQNLNDATFPDMPRNALEHVSADYVMGATEMGPLLGKLVNGGIQIGP